VELYNSKDIKKTQKEHQCHLCWLNIPKETPCFYESGKFDGDFFSRYSHHECAKEWCVMNKDELSCEWCEFRDMENIDEWENKIKKTYSLL